MPFLFFFCSIIASSVKKHDQTVIDLDIIAMILNQLELCSFPHQHQHLDTATERHRVSHRICL